jgi:hypothetical protein
VFRAGGRGRPCLAAPAVPIGRCWTQRTGKARARLPIPRGSTSAARNPNTPASRTPKAKGEEEYIVPCSPTLSNAPEPSWRLPAAGIVKQSLEGMRRRGKQFTTLRLSESKDRLRALPSKSKVKPRRGLIQNAKFTINGFSSRVRFHYCHSEAKPKNLLISSIYSSSARPGRLRGSRFQREPASGARSSVSEREQSLRDMLAIIVILSGAKNLFWARLQMFRCAQHDGCSGSSQRSERQTKCSQTSVSSAYRFFVALLLRMTNY